MVPVLVHGSLSDVIPTVKNAVNLDVGYPTVTINDGVELRPQQAEAEPVVDIGAGHLNLSMADKRYTLAMVDPDAPSPDHPTNREWLHWLVLNLPAGIDVARKGDVAMPYMGPKPPMGVHRYILALYEQPGGVMVQPVPMHERAKFNLQEFAKREGFGDPVAATYFISRH